MATLNDLFEGLERLKAQHIDALILQGRDFYVQAALDVRGQFRLEAVSDEFLDKPLTTAQLLALRRLGFQPPGQVSPNHWQYAAATDLTAAAEMLATTLLEVYQERLEDAEVVDV